MKKVSIIVNKLTLVAFIILLTGFSGGKIRKFEFRFHMHDIQSFVPSYQMAIWLETPDSSYVKTLYLSEYLSYGGYNEPEICYEWSSKAKWDEVTKEEFDAVTAATPSVGDVELKLQCPATILPEGKYLIFVEVHLAEEYNELYSCELEITGKKRMNELNVKYIPGKYPKKTEGDLLTGALVFSK
ncbi:MAG TPA: DUF2271 domain-containing protein [Bacteroidales bacterium]|nr:DUF2271 domain-containing protein [Bacteroidales bacterium]